MPVHDDCTNQTRRLLTIGGQTQSASKFELLTSEFSLLGICNSTYADFLPRKNYTHSVRELYTALDTIGKAFTAWSTHWTPRDLLGISDSDWTGIYSKTINMLYSAGTLQYAERVHMGDRAIRCGTTQLAKQCLCALKPRVDSGRLRTAT
jgi:hypothetical protein